MSSDVFEKGGPAVSDHSPADSGSSEPSLFEPSVSSQGMAIDMSQTVPSGISPELEKAQASAARLHAELDARDAALRAEFAATKRGGGFSITPEQVKAWIGVVHGQVHLGRLAIYTLLAYEIKFYDGLANDASPDSVMELIEKLFSLLGGA